MAYLICDNQGVNETIVTPGVKPSAVDAISFISPSWGHQFSADTAVLTLFATSVPAKKIADATDERMGMKYTFYPDITSLFFTTARGAAGGDNVTMAAFGMDPQQSNTGLFLRASPLCRPCRVDFSVDPSCIAQAITSAFLLRPSAL